MSSRPTASQEGFKSWAQAVGLSPGSSKEDGSLVSSQGWEPAGLEFSSTKPCWSSSPRNSQNTELIPSRDRWEERMRRQKKTTLQRHGRLRRRLGGKIHLLWLNLFYSSTGPLQKQVKAAGLALQGELCTAVTCIYVFLTQCFLKYWVLSKNTWKVAFYQVQNKMI